MAARIVLLGASGFIGSALLRLMTDHGLGAELLVHHNRPARLAEGVRLHRGSVTDLPATLLPDTPHVVIHCASKQIDSDGSGFAVNLQGVDHLCERIATQPHTKAVLFVSSCSVYGDGPQRGVREDEPLRPGTALARSRADCEARLHQLAHDGHCRVEVFRPRFVVGAGDRHVLPGLARLARQGWSLGDGEQRFSVIDVDDFARILLTRALHALQTPAPPSFEAFNVGYAQPVSLQQIERTLSAHLASPPPRHRVPVQPAVLRWMAKLPLQALQRLAQRLSLLGLDHYGDVSRLQSTLDVPWLHRDPMDVIRRAAHALPRTLEPT